jgi:Protein of unknown function DUF262
MPKTKIMTDTDKRAISLSNAMSGIQYVPEPTYWFGIGESVEIGNLEDCVIVDMLEDGKIYEVDYTFTNVNYGNPITNYHQRNFWQWHRIRPAYGEAHNFIKNTDLRLSYSQRTLGDGLLGCYYSFGIDLNPVYQRDFVWNHEDNLSLINSVFNNIDIGKFVFVHKPFKSGDTSYEILDGKQRLNALLHFYQNEYPYNGVYYNELSRHEQNHFANYNISYAQLENLNLEQKLRYFITLNTSGKVMDKNNILHVQQMLQEIENK